MDESTVKELTPDVIPAAHDPAMTAQIEGAAGIVTLNRPRALNALSSAMRAGIAAAFEGWARNPQVYATVIESTSDRAFCAGGDLREMVELGKASLQDALRSVGEEYALNWQLECFTKPTVSLIDGLVVGAGVGISLYGTHRIAGERYSFAMPEVRIGLFPDDGVSWALARMPDEIGMYLALTGRNVGPADAYRLGLVTHCIPSNRFGEIKAALREADPVDPVLDSMHVEPGPGELDGVRAVIARCFTQPGLEQIVGALQAERGSTAAGCTTEWARGVLEDMQRSSPTSLKVTYRHLRRARTLDLRSTLQQDFRLATRFMQGHDFYEGVRATLIDRDQTPKWHPANLDDVPPSAVDAYFTSMGENELQLSTRAEMQAVRA